MTACTKVLIRYVFEEFDINRVEIQMSTRNPKSKAIPERLGFTQEGVLRSNERLREFSDSYVYSLLREEYEKVKAVVSKSILKTLNSLK